MSAVTMFRTMTRLAPVFAVAACMTARAVPIDQLPTQREVEVRFPTAVTLTFRCDTADPPGQVSACAGDSVARVAARELRGAPLEMRGDSLQVAVKWLRNITGQEVQYAQRPRTWISRRASTVEEQHSNPVGTALLVVGVIGLVAAIASAGTTHHSSPPPTPKPAPGPKDF